MLVMRESLKLKYAYAPGKNLKKKKKLEKTGVEHLPHLQVQHGRLDVFDFPGKHEKICQLKEKMK